MAILKLFLATNSMKSFALLGKTGNHDTGSVFKRHSDQWRRRESGVRTISVRRKVWSPSQSRVREKINELQFFLAEMYEEEDVIVVLASQGWARIRLKAKLTNWRSTLSPSSEKQIGRNELEKGSGQHSAASQGAIELHHLFNSW